MIQLIKNRDFYGLGIFLLSALMIGYQQWISPAIGIFLLIVLVELIFVKSLKFTVNKYTLLFVGLYLLYLIGLIWSDHVSIGLKLLEYKMSFFIFPILFLFKKEKTEFWNIIQGFIFGTLILAIRFYIAIFFNSGEPLPGYEISRVILDLHPSYTSIYLTVAAFILAYGYWKNKIKLAVFIVVPTIAAFIYLVVVMNSFAAILFLGLCLFYALAKLVFYFFKWIGLVLFLVSAPFLFLFMLTKIDALKYDLEMADIVMSELSEGKESFIEKNRLEESGTKERMLMWLISAEIIAENPLGVGTGDIDYFLLDKCKKYGLTTLETLNLNPHNQFLQIGIDIGWLGMFYLILMLSIIGFKSIRDKNYILLFTLCILTFNALFESVLQRQSGIVFFTFIICLLLAYYDSQHKEAEQKN